MRNTLLMMSAAMAMLTACSSTSQHTPSILFTKDQIKFAEQMTLSDAEREAMLNKQIYQMNPNELRVSFALFTEPCPIFPNELRSLVVRT